MGRKQIVLTPFLPNRSRYNKLGAAKRNSLTFQHLFFLTEVATGIQEDCF